MDVSDQKEGWSSLKQPRDISHWQGQKQDWKELPLKTPVFKPSGKHSLYEPIHCKNGLKFHQYQQCQYIHWTNSFKPSVSQKNPHTFGQSGKAGDVGWTSVALRQTTVQQGKDLSLQPPSMKACHLSVFCPSSESLGELTLQPAVFPLNCSPFPPLQSCMNSPAVSPYRLPVEPREKEQELPTEAPGCPLPSRLPLSRVPPALLFPQRRVLWQETSPVLLELKRFFTKSKRRY